MISTIIICCIYLFLTLAGMSLIKLGHSAKAFATLPFLNVGISWYTVIGLVLYASSFFVFTFFVSKLKISVAIPVVSGIYCALTVVVGMCLFKEVVTKGQIFGIMLVIVGTVLVGIFK